MPESSLEQKAGENFFGDVVVFKKIGAEEWFVSSFTREPFNHCALMIDENRFINLRLSYRNLFKKAIEGEIKKSGINNYKTMEKLLQKIGLFNGTNITGLIEQMDLRELPKYLDEWVVLRHKEMTNEKRIRLKEVYEKTKIDGYDVDSLLRMAYRHSKKITPRYNDISTLFVYAVGTLVSWTFKNPEEDPAHNNDLLVPSTLLCGTMISGLFKYSLDLETHPEIKWNRMEPADYINPYFQTIKSGKNKRNLKHKP